MPEHWQMVVGKDKKKQFDILKKLMNAPDAQCNFNINTQNTSLCTN